MFFKTYFWFIYWKFNVEIQEDPNYCNPLGQHYIITQAGRYICMCELQRAVEGNCSNYFR